jgi:hypothetical protein
VTEPVNVTKPYDGRHAIYAGWVLGRTMRSGVVPVRAVIDGDGNYQAAIEVRIRPDDAEEPVWQLFGIPYPPPDWKLE